MSNRTVLITISFIAITMLLLSTTQLVTEIILGYTGFTQFNANLEIITLSTSCQHPYYQDKYSNALHIAQKTAFMASVVTFFAIIIALVSIICFINGCREEHRRRAEQTRIQIVNSFLLENTLLEKYHLTQTQIITLYILLSVIILTSAVQLVRYFQIYQDNLHASCTITINPTEILAFAIINSLLCGLGLLSFALLLCLACNYNQEMNRIQPENFSESYRQQIQRIIREVPESERRFYELEERKKKLKEPYLPCNNSILNSSLKREEEQKDKSELGKIQQIESVLYQPQQSPQLMIHSIERVRHP